MDQASSQFLLRLYQNAYQQSPDIFQNSTLRDLRRLLPFDFSAWGAGEAAERMVTDVVTLDQSPRLLMDWSNVAEEDGYCSLALQKLNRAVSFDDLPDYRRSFAYNEHWRCFGTRHMLATIMAEPIDGFVSFVSLFRADAKQHFDEAERRLKNLLMPHISSALRLNREITAERLAEPGEGVAIVNRAGLLLSSRAPFGRLMREEWGQGQRTLPDGVLPPPAQKGRWRGRSIQLWIEPLGFNFLVRARLRHPAERLSPRAAQVAELYAGGYSYKEVAKALSIAPATARNHIAKVYEQLGVNTKAELVRVLAAAYRD